METDQRSVLDAIAVVTPLLCALVNSAQVAAGHAITQETCGASVSQGGTSAGLGGSVAAPRLGFSKCVCVCSPSSSPGNLVDDQPRCIDE